MRLKKPSPRFASITPELVVEALNLGEHVTFDELLDAVTKAHGKRIIIKEIDSSVIPSVTGLWVEKDDKSIILLPEGDNILHRNHAACHEFGHMLLRHEGCGVAENYMPSMFKHVGSSKGIKRILARSLGWNETEIAAERVAYLLSLALIPKDPEGLTDFERVFN